MFDNSDLSQSVIDNLHCLFNSRKGTVPGLEDYGLPDINQYYQNFPRSINEWVVIVELAIKKFEPRIQDLFVKVDGFLQRDNTVVCLIISGELNIKKNQRKKLYVETDFMGNGKSRLRRKDNE